MYFKAFVLEKLIERIVRDTNFITSSLKIPFSFSKSNHIVSILEQF